jgi:formamidopyrimidine-DNA glycosylase
MPELPEVETIRRDLELLNGKTISFVKFLFLKTAHPSAAFLKKNITGAKIKNISRIGKLLIIALDNNYFLLVHLKMTGQLIYKDGRHKIYGGHSLTSQSKTKAVGGDLPNKHTRAILEIKDGGVLFFNDLRKFGYLKLVDKHDLEKIITTGYGPEPLTKEFTLEKFTSIFPKRRINVKALLLNQKLIAGLGNIYVDESLFEARIRPNRIAASLKKHEIAKLFASINLIIKKAIRYRGTTFSDYADAKGNKGNFSKLLKVYGRAKQPCLTCSNPITKIKLAGRGTHYCQYCQK